jgi:hypothetical protein
VRTWRNGVSGSGRRSTSGKARDLLARYAVERGLRTLDAIQLAVALGLREVGVVSVFVAGDQRLCGAAEHCGFSKVDPTNPGALIVLIKPACAEWEGRSLGLRSLSRDSRASSQEIFCMRSADSLSEPFGDFLGAILR